MKRCSYCGAEYPDDATECTVDQTPLGGIPLEPATSIKLPEFGIFSEHKIPISLSLVSYLFFSTGAGLFAAIGMLAFFMVFLAGGLTSDHILIPCFIGGVLAMLVIICLLMFPVIMLFSYVIFAIGFTASEIGRGVSSMVILSRLIGGAIAILFVYVSRGLRMGSPRWRTCALVFTWLQFAIVIFGIVRYFLTGGHHQHEWAAKDWLEYAFGVIVLTWQYRVLTRPDIRDLFYKESRPNAY